MKYSFEKVNEDTTDLVYKDKRFSITKDVRLLTDLQSINSKARKRMLIDLAKDGITTKDLTIETKKDGKTFYDNSNLNELEQTYVQEATLEMFDEISKRCTGMSLSELILDIGFTTEQEVSKFAEDFTMALTGNVAPR